MRKKIVYILGLSHVGSTLLDLTLGSQSQYIGLGEIFQIFRPEENIFNKKVYCSCGKKFEDCFFWGHVAQKLVKKQSLAYDEKYKIVIDAFEEVFGPDAILVDSSKLLKPLQILLQKNEFDIKVIFIIRDVRAWTVSRINTRHNFPDYFQKSGDYIKRLRHYYGWKTYLIQWLIPLLTRSPGYFFWIWYLQNKKMKNFLEQHQVDNLCLSYDELGMDPDFIIPKVYDFLRIEDSTGSYSTEESKSHILVGNVNKADPKRRQGIIYDNRWVYRTEWLLSAALYRNIINYNHREVYRNLREKSIWGK